MLRGAKAGLRARHEDDVAILQAELYDEVSTRVRADSRPWLPIPPNASASPYHVGEPVEEAVFFSVVDLSDNEMLAGEALLWGIDSHNRTAHLGVSLRPQHRGRALGSDVVSVLCNYGFAIRGLNRLQVDTLSDNIAMIRAAEKNGFLLEGTVRRAAWVDGRFADEVILGLLADEWTPHQPEVSATRVGESHNAGPRIDTRT